MSSEIVQQANMAFKEKKYDLAAQHAAQAIEEAPADVRLLKNAFAIAAAAKNTALQTDVLSKLETVANIGNSEALIAAVCFHRQMNNLDKALELANRNADLTDSSLQSERTIVLMQLNRFVDAKASLLAWHALDPANKMILTIQKRLAAAGHAVELPDVPLPAPRPSETIEPTNPLRKAEIADEKKQYGEAAKFVHEAVANKPEDPKAWFMAYRIARATKNEGLQADAVLKLNGFANARHPWLLPVMTAIYRELGEKEAAFNTMLARVRRDPENMDLLPQCAMLAIELKKPSETYMTQVRAVQAKKPEDPQVWLMSYRLAQAINDQEMETLALGRISELAYTAHPELFPVLATAYEKSGDKQKAFELARQGVKRDAKDKKWLAQRAILAQQLGKGAEAYEAYREWSVAAPRNPHPKVQMALMDIAEQRFDDAQRHLDVVLKTAPRDQMALILTIGLQSRHSHPNYALIERTCRTLACYHPTQSYTDIFVKSLVYQDKLTEAYDELKGSIEKSLKERTRPKGPRLIVLWGLAQKFGSEQLDNYKTLFEGLDREHLLTPRQRRTLAPNSKIENVLSVKTLAAASSKGAERKVYSQYFDRTVSGIYAISAAQYLEPVNMPAFAVMHNVNPRSKEAVRLKAVLARLEISARQQNALDALRVEAIKRAKADRQKWKKNLHLTT